VERTYTPNRSPSSATRTFHLAINIGQPQYDYYSEYTWQSSEKY